MPAWGCWCLLTECVCAELPREKSPSTHLLRLTYTVEEAKKEMLSEKETLRETTLTIRCLSLRFLSSDTGAFCVVSSLSGGE